LTFVHVIGRNARVDLGDVTARRRDRVRADPRRTLTDVRNPAVGADLHLGRRAQQPTVALDHGEHGVLARALEHHLRRVYGLDVGGVCRRRLAEVRLVRDEAVGGGDERPLRGLVGRLGDVQGRAAVDEVLLGGDQPEGHPVLAR
jgi:hypothetical protein